jgi:D-inositol-3-phosphate glycosyltransferase
MNVYVRELSRALSDSDIEVDIFTRSQNPSIATVVPLAAKARVIHLKAGPEAPYDKNGVWQHLPEFVHNVVQFSRQEGNSYSLIHSHYWLSGWAASQLKRAWNVPVVHMAHTLGLIKNTVARNSADMEKAIRLKAEREIFEAADRMIAPSEGEKIQLNEVYGVAPERVSIAPCGVDLQLFRPYEKTYCLNKLNLPPSRYLLFVGRIDPVKGIDVLLRAIARVVNCSNPQLKNVHLLIIGGTVGEDGNGGSANLRRLMNMGTELGLSHHVTFLGSKNQVELPYYYSLADACVLPSLYESFGIVALESMACETPVIASNVGGLPSIITDGHNGMLVRDNDEADLADKIVKLLEDPFLKRRIGTQACQDARRYTWDHVCAKIMAIYQETLLEKDTLHPHHHPPELKAIAPASLLTPNS